jgi:hypothetical protein
MGPKVDKESKPDSTKSKESEPSKKKSPFVSRTEDIRVLIKKKHTSPNKDAIIQVYKGQPKSIDGFDDWDGISKMIGYHTGEVDETLATLQKGAVPPPYHEELIQFRFTDNALTSASNTSSTKALCSDSRFIKRSKEDMKPGSLLNPTPVSDSSSKTAPYSSSKADFSSKSGSSSGSNESKSGSTSSFTSMLGSKKNDDKKDDNKKDDNKKGDNKKGDNKKGDNKPGSDSSDKSANVPEDIESKRSNVAQKVKEAIKNKK